MKGFVWGRLRSKYFGHFVGLILDLEAETLSESRSFKAASAHIGFEGWLYEMYGFLNRARLEFWRCVAENIDLGNRCFPPSKPWGPSNSIKSSRYVINSVLACRPTLAEVSYFSGWTNSQYFVEIATHLRKPVDLNRPHTIPLFYIQN